MRGVVLTTEDEFIVRDFGLPLHQTVRGTLGGYFEIVRPRGLARPYVMLVNESGLLLNLPINTVW